MSEGDMEQEVVTGKVTDIGQTMNDLTDFLGRRVARRNQIFAVAQLLTPSLRQLVRIVNISVTGAKLQLQNSVGVSPACLIQDGGGLWGEVVWCSGTFAGMRFDRSLTAEYISKYVELYNYQDFVDFPELMLKYYINPPNFPDLEKAELSEFQPDHHQIGK